MNPDFFIGMTLGGLAILGGGVYLGKKTRCLPNGPTTKPTLPRHQTGLQKNSESSPEQLFLSDASDIWTEKVIPLSVASVIWVEAPEEKRDIPRPSFTHEAIDRFYAETIEHKKSIYGKKKDAIIALLNLLDKDGECPSVVNNGKHPDPENKFSKDVFSMLAEIPLYEHTITVATSMAQKVGRETLLPDAIIAALGHDIGKIPDYHDRGYTTGDHPVISSIVLNGMKEFTALSNHNDLEQIVRRHHDINPAHPLAALLKECDLVARNSEIAEKMKASVMAAKAESATATTDEQAKYQIVAQTVAQEAALQQSTPHPLPIPDPNEERDHPLGWKTSGIDPKYKPQRADIPWFNPDDMLNKLKTYINIVHQGRWGAVSMPDGMVYVNSDCLWGVIKKVAPGDIIPMLNAADVDEASKRNLMYTVIWTLSEQRQAIAAEMLHPDYFMIPVNILSGTGKLVVSQTGAPQLMAPFRAEAFGALPSDLENTKTATLRRMVKSIKPKNQGGCGHE
jgi:hypothetical protein